jgi:hypothetical protein
MILAQISSGSRKALIVAMLLFVSATIAKAQIDTPLSGANTISLLIVG